MKTPHVASMISRNGNPIANQFTISTETGYYFQSYRSIIAHKANDGSITLDEKYWDYSVTISKYLNNFLGENKAETRKKIETGTYKLANLN